MPFDLVLTPFGWLNTTPYRIAGFGSRRTFMGVTTPFFCFETSSPTHGQTDFAECQPQSCSTRVTGSRHSAPQMSCPGALVVHISTSPALLTRRSITRGSNIWNGGLEGYHKATFCHKHGMTMLVVLQAPFQVSYKKTNICPKSPFPLDAIRSHSTKSPSLLSPSMGPFQSQEVHFWVPK